LAVASWAFPPGDASVEHVGMLSIPLTSTPERALPHVHGPLWGALLKPRPMAVVGDSPTRRGLSSSPGAGFERAGEFRIRARMATMFEERLTQRLSLFSKGIMNRAGGILRFRPAHFVPSRLILCNRMRPTVREGGSRVPGAVYSDRSRFAVPIN
jgi:hypothetical protein